MVTWLRSLAFFLYFLAVSVAMHILALPTLILPRKAIVRASQSWSAVLLWGLKWIAGLDYEVRGAKPPDGVLVAAKHMSMWDTLTLYMLLDDAIVVLKKELKAIPFYGWFAAKADMIFIDRKGHARAILQMAAHAAKAMDQGRSLVIFPEGTRKKPGEAPDYKPGIAALYGRLERPCVPVALNSGLFWTGQGGFVKKKGRIVIEFLPAIPPGLPRAEFMRTLEERIENATNKLVAEGCALLGERAGK